MFKYYKNPQNASYSLRGPNRPGCLIFAEGLSEALFLEKWLAHERADANDIAVVCFRGERNLGLTIKNLSEDENFQLITRFGFFLDSEQGPAHRKEASISALLKQHSIIDARESVRGGVLLRSGHKRIVAHVSPDNQNAGYIEHTVMIELANHQLGRCITEFSNCLQRTTGRPTDPKSTVQAFLGAHTPGLCGTGRGFEVGALDVMHDAYDMARRSFETIL